MTLAGLERYLARHAWLDPGAPLPPPDSRLKLAIVIPSLAERASLPRVLDSLAQGSRRLEEAEVLVLVNNPEHSPRHIVDDNEATLRDIACRPSHALRILGVNHSSPGRGLPASQAGVGMARRLGMDLALQRLAAAGAPERSAIACLDADSPVAPGYIDAILAVFDRPGAPVGGLCRYAHPQPPDSRLAAGIRIYEIWLRYLETGLALAAPLYAFPMIGSCMIASALGYALADGMPLRQAAEDFHFLRKLAKISGLRGLAQIPAMVYPEARPSGRVPFGTGRAMQQILARGPETYGWVEPAQAYRDLACFFETAKDDPDLGRLRHAASPRLDAFLEAEGGWPVLARLRRNYPNPGLFSQAVLHWFDSLRIVRYTHAYVRDTEKVWLFQALAELFISLGEGQWLASLPALPPGDMDPEKQAAWLSALRARQAGQGHGFIS